MSNMYKEWIWDKIQEVVIERGLIDYITSVTPPACEGTPCYVIGFKNNKAVKYHVECIDEGWVCTKEDFDS